MSARAAAAEATRERIIEVAARAFLEHWHDDVTLRGIAGEAGVALQTVVNHFGSKEALFAVATQRVGDHIEQTRFSVRPGDLDGALRTLIDDYETRGNSYLRTLAVEDRIPVVRPMLERGRDGHEKWVETVFTAALDGLTGDDRDRRMAQLVVATDVYTWKLLRRDKGLSPEQTAIAMRELVLALHDHPVGGSA